MPSIIEIAEESRQGQPSAWGDEAGKPVALNISENNFADESVQNILAAIHSGIYQTTFPLDDEREELATWSKKLLDGENKAPKQFFTAHFTDIEAAADLADQMQPMLAKLYADPAETLSAREQADFERLQQEFTKLTVSFIVSEYYDETNAALINYVIRNKEFDGKGTQPKYDAKDMVDHQVMQCQAYATSLGEALHVVGWELNNPDTVKFFNPDGTPNFEIDVMDPYRRQQIVEGFGGRDINFKWIQSPLDTTLKMCADLRLYSYPIPGGVVVSDIERGQALEKYVNAFYKSFPEDIAGRFETAKEYADDCSSRASQIERLPDATSFVVNSDPTFLSNFGEKIEELLPAARQILANVGATVPDDKNIPADLIAQLQGQIGRITTDPNEAKDILNHTLGLLKQELNETALAVEGMIAGIEEIKSGAKTFQSTVELKDDAQVSEGQRKLKVYDLAVQIKEAAQKGDSSTLKDLSAQLDLLNNKYAGQTCRYQYTDKAGNDVDVTVNTKQDVERMVKIIGDDTIWKQFTDAVKTPDPVAPTITKPKPQTASTNGVSGDVPPQFQSPGNGNEFIEAVQSSPTQLVAKDTRSPFIKFISWISNDLLFPKKDYVKLVEEPIRNTLKSSNEGTQDLAKQTPNRNNDSPSPSPKSPLSFSNLLQRAKEAVFGKSGGR